ncbi:GDYXXLXY domain-containing protein [Myxococcus sp. CA051A]|uniref:GDYXXLXY domain-containing protein n=1 Tax=Myxococcus sp. CA051A TaxID=2741739 RepID=UPI00157A3E28|nr:GDYXXLXY domain-containing protein [Myxococcus sp. CA051A]NTX59281.1 GDYXXLXY domain-containing protein [Myxococcus sp. CA051A]
MRSILFFVGLALALLVPLGLVAQKEHVLATGQTVLLELAPRDPRSLMQGDYMVLDYALTRALNVDGLDGPSSGLLVLKLDEHGVGRFVRMDSPDQPLAPGEFKLSYRTRKGRTRLGAESFFFQEGHADHYARARYGELRAATNGSSVLVGLRDEQRQPLGAGPDPEASPTDDTPPSLINEMAPSPTDDTPPSPTDTEVAPTDSP